MKKEQEMKYSPGMFDQFKQEDKLNHWAGFSELMEGLGYEMDCLESVRGLPTRDWRVN